MAGGKKRASITMGMFSTKDEQQYYNRSWCCRCNAWHTSLDLQGSRCANCHHENCGLCEIEVIKDGKWVRMLKQDHVGLAEKRKGAVDAEMLD
jgi:hypothetical protein